MHDPGAPGIRPMLGSHMLICTDLPECAVAPSSATSVRGEVRNKLFNRKTTSVQKHATPRFTSFKPCLNALGAC